MSLLDIFKDNNKYNEKTIVGALSMIVMIIFALVDIITGIIGMDLVINETIVTVVINVCI